MSTSLEKGLNSMAQSPSGKDATTWKESMLTSAFDDQIKLVESSLASFNGNLDNRHKKGTRKKFDNKGLEEKTKEQKEQNLFSNRSKIYRFDAADSAQITPSKIATQIHPPADSRPESPDDPDSETEPRAKMLMSWYMAGYHTGYYDAMRKMKRNLE